MANWWREKVTQVDYPESQALNSGFYGETGHMMGSLRVALAVSRLKLAV